MKKAADLDGDRRFALMNISIDYPNTRHNLPKSVVILCDLATDS